MSNEVEFFYRSVEVNAKFQLLYVYVVPEGDKEARKQTGYKDIAGKP